MENNRREKISFVIPVLNGQAHIKRCIDHIIAEKDAEDGIVVVDNGSTDATVEILSSYDNIKILEYPDITIAAMRNRGAEASDGSILAFIDSDVLVCAGWRDAVMSALCDSEIKATGSICCIPDNATWVERAWWSFGRKDATRVNYINTGNFIIRKEAFEAVNGFDESLISDEDSDIGSRLNKEEFWLLDNPKIRAIHLGNAKTLSAFMRKEKWHATSIIDGLVSGGIDKAMIMTFIFMALVLGSLLAIPLAIKSPHLLLPIIGMILFVPLLTSLFRSIQYANYRYFFFLTVLYFVFYSARSIRVVTAFHKTLFKTNND